MYNYLNQSIYTCKDPRLLITDVATTSEQCYVTRLKKDSTIERVLRYKSYKRTPIVIRCGKCQGCRKLTNDQWYLRLYHHFLSQPDSKMIFVTLTFNEEEYRYIMDYVTDMPKDEYSGTDFTPVYRKYIVPLKKRLRAERGENLEFDFFCVSELGDDNQRFHFHICLFWRNWRFFLDAATRWNKFHPYSKHYVKTKSGLRLQSDLEAYLQHKIERQWSNERYTNLENRYIFERRGKSRRISATGSIGNVTLFEADGVGMLKYVTSYSLKCQHDGVTTYHRQTPALGKKYVAGIFNARYCEDMALFRSLSPADSPRRFHKIQIAESAALWESADAPFHIANRYFAGCAAALRPRAGISPDLPVSRAAALQSLLLIYKS